MRLLICCDHYFGGAGNVAQQIASYYSQIDGNMVSLMLLDIEGKPKYDLSKVIIINRNLIPSHISNPFNSVFRYLSTLRNIRQQIHQTKPDVIVSFLNSISTDILLSSFFDKSVPIIVSERSNPFAEWNENGICFNIKWKLSLLRADRIVYQFNDFISFYKLGIRKSVVIPNMMDVCVNTHTEKSCGVISFCTFASLVPVKRIDLMIKMFISIHQSVPNSELDIYGTGECEQQLLSQYSGFDFIHFNGRIVDSRDYLKQHDIFLLTSQREGFPNALIEAMGSGVIPVVFECHPGFREIIDNNVNGYLISQNDEQSFIQTSVKLATDSRLRDEMSSAATLSVQKYSKEIIFDKWDKCIKSVLPS